MGIFFSFFNVEQGKSDMKLNHACWDFPGGQVVKTMRFHCRGRGTDSIPGGGTNIPHARNAAKKNYAC